MLSLSEPCTTLSSASSTMAKLLVLACCCSAGVSDSLAGPSVRCVGCPLEPEPLEREGGRGRVEACVASRTGRAMLWL